jgi:hypothetical protein
MQLLIVIVLHALFMTVRLHTGAAHLSGQSAGEHL